MHLQMTPHALQEHCLWRYLLLPFSFWLPFSPVVVSAVAANPRYGGTGVQSVQLHTQTLLACCTPEPCRMIQSNGMAKTIKMKKKYKKITNGTFCRMTAFILLLLIWPFFWNIFLETPIIKLDYLLFLTWVNEICNLEYT